MNQSNRVCKIKGHDHFPIFHIFALLECTQPTRWCCSECISLGIHNHNKLNNSHVMKTTELLIKLKSESEKFKGQFNKIKTLELNLLEKILKECNGLEDSIIDYRKSIEEQIQIIEWQQEKFKSYVNNLVHNNFELLDNKRQMNQLKLIYNNLIKINNYCHLIKLNNKSYQQNRSQKINIKQMIIVINLLIQRIGNILFKKLIKPNIYWHHQYQKMNNILHMEEMISCQKFMTQNKKRLLYAGLGEGYVYGYDVQNDFKEIYKQQIHSSDIYNIITIQNEYLIICSVDQSIIKIGIKSKQQMFKLTGHTNFIRAFDYNDKDDIIISGSIDKSIKLWNCRNQSIIINKEQSHYSYISQIQLINNNVNILSLDMGGNLYKWKIDLISKDLIILQSFGDKNKIFNFQQVNQDQNLLLICNNYVIILNQQGETINKINHGGQDSTYFDCRQLDNIKYIQIRAKQKIILATAED